MVYDGDVTYQVSVFDTVSEERHAVVALLASWKDEGRRVLAATATATVAATNTTSETTQAQIFTAKACGYGAFLILLYFILATVYCMWVPRCTDAVLHMAAPLYCHCTACGCPTVLMLYCMHRCTYVLHVGSVVLLCAPP